MYDGTGSRIGVGELGDSGWKYTYYIGDSIEIKPDDTGKLKIDKIHIIAGGRRIATVTPQGAKQYYHVDHLGSTRVITDAHGKRLREFYYSPFGKIISDLEYDYKNPDVNISTGQIVESIRGYTGQKIDSSGLMYYRARYYNPDIMRFVQADSIVPDPFSSQDFNRYSYVVNNPVNYTDPTGHWSVFGGRSGKETKETMITVGIIAAEIALIAAAAGSATPWVIAAHNVAVGALIGSGVGATTGYMANGKEGMMNGAIVGGIAGGISGGIGGEITANTGAFWEQFFKEGIKGGIRGTGPGVASGYKGGKGSRRDMIEGDAWGFGIGFGFGAGKVAFFGRDITNNPNIQQVLNSPSSKIIRGNGIRNITIREGGILSYLNGAHPAITLGDLINVDTGHFVYNVNNTYFMETMGEELWHSTQYETEGFSKYLAKYLYFTSKYGYMNNPYEINGRAMGQTFAQYFVP